MVLSSLLKPRASSKISKKYVEAVLWDSSLLVIIGYYRQISIFYEENAGKMLCFLIVGGSGEVLKRAAAKLSNLEILALKGFSKINDSRKFSFELSNIILRL